MSWNPWGDRARLERRVEELEQKHATDDLEKNRLRDQVASRDERLRSKTAREDGRPIADHDL
jgi:hypothetical protein